MIWFFWRVTHDDVEKLHSNVFQRDEAHRRMLKRISYRTLLIAAVISWNAFLMFVADVVFEILMAADVFPKVPFRLDFLSLTTVSGLLGYQMIVGLKKGELEVSENALLISGCVECALIIGDIVFIVQEGDKYSIVYPFRSPFLFLTTVNLFLVIYLEISLHSWWCGFKSPREEMWEEESKIQEDGQEEERIEAGPVRADKIEVNMIETIEKDDEDVYTQIE